LATRGEEILGEFLIFFLLPGGERVRIRTRGEGIEKDQICVFCGDFLFASSAEILLLRFNEDFHLVL